MDRTLDSPYVSSPLNYLLDEHIVYAGLLVYLIAVRAGHIFGLDGFRREAAGDNDPAIQDYDRL